MALSMYDDWATGDEYPCDDCEDRELYYSAKMDVIQEQMLPLFRHLRGRVELSEEEIDNLIDSLTDELGFRKPDWTKFERMGDVK